MLLSLALSAPAGRKTSCSNWQPRCLQLFWTVSLISAASCSKKHQHQLPIRILYLRLQQELWAKMSRSLLYLLQVFFRASKFHLSRYLKVKKYIAYGSPGKMTQVNVIKCTASIFVHSFPGRCKTRLDNDWSVILKPRGSKSTNCGIKAKHC